MKYMVINSHPAVVKISPGRDSLHIVIIVIPVKVDGLACSVDDNFHLLSSYSDNLN